MCICLRVKAVFSYGQQALLPASTLTPACSISSPHQLEPPRHAPASEPLLLFPRLFLLIAA